VSADPSYERPTTSTTIVSISNGIPHVVAGASPSDAEGSAMPPAGQTSPAAPASRPVQEQQLSRFYEGSRQTSKDEEARYLPSPEPSGTELQEGGEGEGEVHVDKVLSDARLAGVLEEHGVDEVSAGGDNGSVEEDSPSSGSTHEAEQQAGIAIEDSRHRSMAIAVPHADHDADIDRELQENARRRNSIRLGLLRYSQRSSPRSQLSERTSSLRVITDPAVYEAVLRQDMIPESSPKADKPLTAEVEATDGRPPDEHRRHVA